MTRLALFLSVLALALGGLSVTVLAATSSVLSRASYQCPAVVTARVSNGVVTVRVVAYGRDAGTVKLRSVLSHLPPLLKVTITRGSSVFTLPRTKATLANDPNLWLLYYQGRQTLLPGVYKLTVTGSAGSGMTGVCHLSQTKIVKVG